MFEIGKYPFKKRSLGCNTNCFKKCKIQKSSKSKIFDGYLIIKLFPVNKRKILLDYSSRWYIVLTYVFLIHIF